MTTTDLAMPALPSPRRHVLHLKPRLDLDRRPAGRHAAPADPDALDYWLAEGIAQAEGHDAAYRHGRRCACCRAVPGQVEAAS